LKGLILSGGTGSRLRPITYTRAKQLVPVGNVPIIHFGIKAIRDAGITDIGIVVGDTGEEIMQALEDGSRFGVKFTYIHQEKPLGLAHAVKVSEEFLGDESFVMYLGDNLILSGIKSLVQEFSDKNPDALLLLSRVKDPQRFGVAELSGNRIVSLEEKPQHPKSDLALVGVYMFNHRIFNAIDNIKPSKRNELEITDAIQYLIDHKSSVLSHIVSGWWKDTGKLQDMLEANRMYLDTIKTSIEGEIINSKIEHRVVLGSGSTVKGSTVRGPVVIGKNTSIIDSFIGPFTSLGDNVSIINSEIENSIVMEQCRITDIETSITDSLLGKGAEVRKTSDKPRRHRLMIGELSSIEII
jgi:glucose-1-phosphate thymidylyltransferase